MSRKVKQLPKGTILFHYTKNGKVVSDLKIDVWYKNLAQIINTAIQFGSTLIIKIGTENMVNATRLLVVNEFISHKIVRYRYGRRIFRIDCDGRFVGVPGKHYPKNFLGETERIQQHLPNNNMKEYEEEMVDGDMEETGDTIKKLGFMAGNYSTISAHINAPSITVSLNGENIIEQEGKKLKYVVKKCKVKKPAPVMDMTDYINSIKPIGSSSSV